MLGERPLVFEKKGKKGTRAFELPCAPAPLADTHAHLLSFWSKDPAEALARAALAGVRRLVTLYDPIGDAEAVPDAAAYVPWLRDTVARARELFEAYRGEKAAADGELLVDSPDPAVLFDNIRYLVGVHPYGAARYTAAVHTQIAAALDDPWCVGIGEIGLDYHLDADDEIEPAPHGLQQEVMARQLREACERNVPVELHLRNDGDDEARTAHADAYRVLREVGVPQAGCVLHCFGEDRATMERFVELGCHIAFGGAATFKRNEAVREAFAACPLDRVLLETDCPYMSPEPLRGLECEPTMIVQTARVLMADRAARTGEDERAIARAAWDNAGTLFAR